MPGQDFSRPLVGAGASAKNDFASAEANAGVNFIGAAQLKRGFKTEIGITAFTNANAGVSKFIAANIEGTAFASAKASLQGQLLMNLFKEFGFVVKAEAVAAAAAGVKANLGINVGDFVNLALQDKSNLGLPIELLIMLLEEVEIGGSFYIDVSFSAQALLTLSLSGTLLPKPGEKAGFRFATQGGAGLAKGMTMSFGAGIGFKDFRKFYGRAVDRTVDEVINQVNANLPEKAKVISPYITAFGPIAKISLRLSYDIGEKIIKNNIGRTTKDAQALCNECVKVIVEEVQRFSFEKLAEYSLQEIKEHIIEAVNHAADDLWDKVAKERNELADKLSGFPAEPFQPTIENATYWKDFILKTIALVEKLYPIGTADEATAEKIAILYCTTELSMEAIRAKVNMATAYAVVIGADMVSANSKPFEGALTTQPPPSVKNTINTKLGKGAAANLEYVDLLEYLVDDIIIDNALAKIPELKTFIEIFKEDFNDAEREILKLLLSSAGAFIQEQNGIKVPKDALRVLVKSIDRFLTKKFKTEVLTEINKHISDETLRTYLDEVFLTCVIYTKDMALDAALDWEKAPYTNDDFTEALAGVMMMFLGRTIVLMGDTLITATQNETQKICNEIAAKIETNPNHKDLALVKHWLKDEQVKQLVVDTLRVGGEVLGPMPDDTRKRVRMLLYQIFEVIKPGKEEELLKDLQNDFFIPNISDIEALTRELAEIARYRFTLFAEKVLLNIGKFILESLEELFIYLADLVVNWEKHLAESLLFIAGELKTIDQKIILLNGVIITQYGALQTAYSNFISKLNSTQIKNAVKAELVKRFISTAELVLKNDPAYKALPRNIKADAENAMNLAVAAVIDSPVMNPVFNAINAVGTQMDGLLPEAKRLDRNGNLPEQFLDLVLDKAEEKIRHHFRNGNPAINIGVNFSYTIPEVIITPAIHTPAIVIKPAKRVSAWKVNGVVIKPAYTEPAIITPAVNIPAVKTPAKTIRVNISLGKIEVNLNLFINIIRQAINTSDFYRTKLNELADKLGDVMAKEFEKAAAELQKANTQKRQGSINKIAGELTNKTPEITILKPAPFAKYKNEVAVEIQLKETPASFLGLKTDELQRVHLFLNGKSIALKQLPPGDVISATLQNIPTVIIKCKPPQADLVEGNNTLTVLVIAKGAKRIQQNVHFMYSQDAKPGIAKLQPAVTKQQLQQKVADAKKYAGEQSLLTFKNIAK